MKRLIALFSILIMAISCFAQYDFWSAPVQATPDEASCYNGILKKMQFIPGEEPQHYLVYNREVNDTTIGVFARSIYPKGAEHKVYFEEGKKIILQDIMQMDYYSNEFMLFLEIADDNVASRDIHFLTIDNGEINNPQVLANTSEDEHHVRCSEDPRRVVWQCADTIKTVWYQHDNQLDTIFATEPLVIEGGNCHNPEIVTFYPSIQYIQDDISTQRIKSVIIHQNNPDFEIDTVYSAVQLSCLKASNSMSGNNEIFSFQKVFNNSFQIFFKSEYNSGIDSLNWLQDNSFNPAFYNYDIPICQDFMPGCIAVELNNDTTNDIYASVGFVPSDISELFNISQTENLTKNPVLHEGKYDIYSFDIVLLYEEIWDNKSHLMVSVLNMLWGGTNENQPTNTNITISPNPITSNFSITINNPETSEMQFTLYGLNGMKSKTLSRDVNAGIVNEIPFSVADFGDVVTPGPFVLECRDGEKVESVKIMIL